MVNFTEYTPASIVFPEELDLKRRLYKNRSHLKNVDSLTEEDLVNYEHKTVFYDLYFSKNGAKLIGIGPPALNFASEIKGLKICEEGSEKNIVKRVSIKKGDRVCFFSISLSKKFDPNKTIPLNISFPCGFSVSREIKPIQLDDVFLQITTLQKNNQISWILDWIKYFYFHGARRVLIYDNGSDNYSEIKVALSEITLDLDVILISWPFPYGPLKSHANKFCKAGENNHACRRFGKSQWSGHFDLDEYPVSVEKETLADLLKSQRKLVGLVKLDNYWVENVDANGEGIPIEDSRDVSARTFLYRRKNSRNGGYKYFMRSSAYRSAKTHNGEVKLGFKRKLLPLDTAYFLHYRRLTTNWKSEYYDRTKENTYDPSIMAKDTSVVDFLEAHQV